MRITVEHYGKRAVMEIPETSNMESVLESFIGALLSVGWSYNVILSWLAEFVSQNTQD
jgi:hypothetical protein